MIAYLGLGSNVGRRRRSLVDAVCALSRLPRTRVLAVSSLYETAYVGPGSQEPYLNACIALETGLRPRELLAATQSLERRAGRIPEGHMLPRTLDIDLLDAGGVELRSEGLRLPHPRMGQRRFVLEPLAELAAELVPAGGAASVSELLAAPAVQAQIVSRTEGSDWCEKGEAGRARSREAAA